MKKIFKKIKREINFEWIKRYLLIPLGGILFVSLFILLLFISFKRYLNNKLKEEKIKQQLIIEEETIRNIELEAKKRENEKKEKEDQIKKQLEEIENTKVKNNIAYYNRKLSEQWPIGTYVKDIPNNKYGVVKRCEYPSVLMQEGWSFEVIDLENGFNNPDYEYSSYKEWKNWTNKQLNKQNKEQKSKSYELLRTEHDRQTKLSKEKFPPNPKYSCAEYKGEYYYVVKWDGSLITLKKDIGRNGKREEGIIVEISNPELKQINYNDFFKLKNMR